MTSKEVTLSSGIVVKAVPIPQKVYDIIRMKYPDPPVPIGESSKTATGELMRFETPNDPDYLEALATAERLRQLAWAEAMLLFGLPEVEVPYGYRCPRCQFTAKSEEDMAAEGRVIMASEDGPYCCPRCLDDCELPQGNIPEMERHIWEPPVDDIKYIDSDWTPREGLRGRRLDYIEWELLVTVVDHQKVISALNALSMVSGEAADAIEDSFQGDLEVPGTREAETRDTD